MNPTDIKQTLETIGYPVQGKDATEMLGSLHSQYGAVKVGSSVHSLGDAAPLYVRAGNVAHLVDNEYDLNAACRVISNTLRTREGAKPVTMQKEVRSVALPVIRKAIEGEIDNRERTKRALGFDPADFPVTVDGMRQQSRSSDKILDGLLSTKRDTQLKALAAFRGLMIVQEG